jgi:hypothetical protein
LIFTLPAAVTALTFLARHRRPERLGEPAHDDDTVAAAERREQEVAGDRVDVCAVGPAQVGDAVAHELQAARPGLPGGTKRFATSEDSMPNGVTSMTLLGAFAPGRRRRCSAPRTPPWRYRRSR